MILHHSANLLWLCLNQILFPELYSITVDFSMLWVKWQIYRFEFNQGRLVQIEG